ncbi:MAG: OmpH family outer membrane protein [Treponema sp.]|nr:OmpH family outer membrane protein [Treponema sp.]
MIKRGCIVFVLFLTLGFFLEAQQLTRFAVVDLTKVYTSFFRDSRAVREFEERSARVQAEIDRMTAEIQKLRSDQLDAQAKGDESRALRLENEIYRKSEYLKEYYQVKTAELADQRNKLSQSGSFLDQVYSEIRYIAESEGYSMVLNLKENTGILWYSQTVDITEKLIQNLLAKAGR